MEILLEDANFRNPIFMNATFYLYPVRKKTDLINNEIMAKHKVVIESENWKPKSNLEIMFVSDAFDLFGKESFVIEEVNLLDKEISFSIRKDEECYECWHILLRKRAVN